MQYRFSIHSRIMRLYNNRTGCIADFINCVLSKCNSLNIDCCKSTIEKLIYRTPAQKGAINYEVLRVIAWELYTTIDKIDNH